MKVKAIFLVVFVVFFCFGVAHAQEEITLTTYYPAPYGEYQKLSISGDGSYPAPTDADIDLVVKGRVGIGTASPDYQLQVERDYCT